MNYEISAVNIHGCHAHDFIGRKFKSMHEALACFDNAYSRRGFQIMIYRHSEDSIEPVLARIVKSTFR